jgi:hypothetical protein
MTRATILALTIVLLSLGPVGCIKESHEVIVIMATGLDGANDYWEKHGRPANFDPATVCLSKSESYYAFTNEIRVAGTVYHGQFAARSTRVPISGALVRTHEGIFLWIRDSDDKIVISPLRNGIQ